MDLSHRLHSLLIMLCLSVMTSYAQQDNVSGRVIDNDTKEAMVRATLQLYRLGRVQNGKQDTTFVKGSFTDEEGHFTITGVSAGQYLMKFTFLGYKEQKRDITKVRGRQLQLGDITMEADAIQLGEAVVTANVPKMVVKDDTLIYNADAFRVPEGSVIEALVEALPGAKIDEDGGITINGKSVRKFKMDGRDFMTGG